jgi:hypothetical protein
VAAAQQCGDDVETRIVSGSADQPDVSLFDVGKKEILLGLVEPVDFIDEHDGPFLRLRPRVFEDITQFRHVREDCVDAKESGTGFIGYDMGQGCLSTTRRAIEEDASKSVGFD